MTFYSVMLFFHVMGVLTLCIAFGMEWMSLRYLRNSATVEEIRMGAKLTASGLPLNLFGVLAMLVPGGYLATKMGAWRQGWIEIALVTMLLIGGLGGGITGWRMRAIRRASAEGVGQVSRVLRMRVDDTLLLASFHIRAMLILGAVFLMVGKPDFGASLLVIGVAIVCGFGWTVSTRGRLSRPWPQQP